MKALQIDPKIDMIFQCEMKQVCKGKEFVDEVVEKNNRSLGSIGQQCLPLFHTDRSLLLKVQLHEIIKSFSSARS